MKKFLSAIFYLLLLIPFCANVKIDSELEQKIKLASSSEEISVIVFLKERTDKIPSYLSLEQKISLLEDFSKTSQLKVTNFLKEKQKAGVKLHYKNYWVFNGFSLRANKSLIEEISKIEDVDKIYLNKRLYLPPSIREKIPDFEIKKLSTLMEDNLLSIRTDKAWELGYRGNGIKIGIADTGVRSTHVDLFGKILLQATFDLTGKKTSDTANDDDGHGTHVAGIIAGSNASGKYTGIAPQSSLLIAKVFNPDANYDSVASGIQWLITNGARVINLSLGSDKGYADPFLKTVVDNADSLGVLIVAAIGNFGPESESTTSPGNVPNAIGVGATDNLGEIATLSSRGPISWAGLQYVKPDVVAPGLSIKSCDNKSDTGYIQMSGTSMACPHVVGTIALMLQANSSLTNNNIRSIIKNSSIKKSEITYPNNTYGYGKIDVLNAILSAKSGDTTPPTIESVTSSGKSYKQNIYVSAKILDNFSSTVNATLYYKNDTLVWQSVPMTKELTSNYYNGVIKADDVISDISYYVEAVDEAGNLSRSPLTAPVDCYQISVEQAKYTAISNVKNVPNPFAAGKETTTFFYELSKPAQVTFYLININGKIVKVFTQNGVFGTNSITWDGLLADGEIASNGVYFYHIVARSNDGTLSTAKGKLIILK